MSTDMTMMEMFEKMMQDNRESIIAAVQEMKKPSVEEQARLDDARNSSMELTRRRVEDARSREKDIADGQSACRHLSKDGQKTNLRGQVNSNGFAKAYCSGCQYLSDWFECHPHELTGGLNMDQWGVNAFAIVQQRIKASGKPKGIPKVPAGTFISFDSAAA